MSIVDSACDLDFKRLINEVNVLLISDLHYDKSKEDLIALAIPDGGKSNLTAKDINSKLVESLPKDDDWEPDMLIVAGDLVNQGKLENYVYYKDLIDKITTKFPRLRYAVFTTPGNHDINRDNIVAAHKYLNSLKPLIGIKTKNSYTRNPVVDNIYTVSQYSGDKTVNEELINELKYFEKEYFKNYLLMEKELIAEKILELTTKEYPVDGLNTIYYRNILGINLVSINSSFFCNFSNSTNDRNNLFFIRSIVEQMNTTISLHKGPVVSFMHHPFYYMHESEYIYPIVEGTESESNNFNKIAEKSDLILSGHVHGELHEPSVIHQKAFSITNGTSFTNDEWKNKCYPFTYAIININKQLNKFRLRSFKFDLKDKIYKVNNFNNSEKYYPFQGSNSISDTSSELEKINIVKYYYEIEKTSTESEREMKILVVQLRAFENRSDPGLSSLSFTEFKISAKLDYCFFERETNQSIVIVKVADIYNYNDIIAMIKNFEAKYTTRNIVVFFAFKISILDSEGILASSDKINLFSDDFKRFIQSMKLNICRFNFLYY